MRQGRYRVKTRCSENVPDAEDGLLRVYAIGALLHECDGLAMGYRTSSALLLVGQSASNLG